VKVAVTGGSGVVGRSVVRHLVDEGHEVKALARSAMSASVVEGLGARPIPGDVLDLESLLPLVTGSDWVFHVAGVNEMCSRSPEHMERVNLEGTANVLTACKVGKVGRLIHTSSAATIGEVVGAVGTEDSPHRGRYLSRYERSKHQSERLVFEEAADLDVVAVNPSSVQGPGRATGTGKLFVDLLNGRLPFLVETTISIVDIDDCARGHVLAARNAAPGERYLLSGASLSMRQALDTLHQITGRSLNPRFVPGWVAAAGAGAVELGARALGRDPRVCREMVRVLRAGHVYDGGRASRDLGLGYTPVETTIRRTIDWFQSEGLLG
jgi:dihydroflavonol-4-reductase